MVISVFIFASLVLCLWLGGLDFYHTFLVFLALCAASLLLYSQNRQLRKLAKAMEEFSPQRSAVQLTEQGGGETRAVIRSFNKLSERVHQCHKERELCVAEVCHDLLTPLARIRLASEMLSDSDNLLAKGINQDAEECRLIINQVTDFACSADKSLSTRVSINLLIQEVIGSFLSRDSCQIETELNEQTIPVFADPVALRRAISNLITNAIRYGHGWIRVSSGICHIDKCVWVCVEDNGPGIEKSEVERLIQPFERGEESANGAGLGLAIVRRIVRQHSGVFTVCNRKEGGLKARLTISYIES